MNIIDIKCQKPILKVEGKWNGIKTLITNMFDLAKALKIPPEYITKFMGSSQGSQSKYDINTGKSTINGKIELSTILTILNEFIKKFVLCEKCKLPETIMNIDNKDIIHMKCNACGHDTLADQQEKLYNFILNHPPPKQMIMEDIKKKKKLKQL